MKGSRHLGNVVGGWKLTGNQVTKQLVVGASLGCRSSLLLRPEWFVLKDLLYRNDTAPYIGWDILVTKITEFSDFFGDHQICHPIW